jgi:DNA excision repair protein ERCC-2
LSEERVRKIFEEAELAPRVGQLEVTEKLAEFIESGKRILFAAPTGWGKTIAVLAALKAASAIPAYWLVRALAIGERIAEDAARLGMFAYVAGGREKTCPLAEQLGDSIHDFCKIARHKCPHARLPPEPPVAKDWREILKLAKGYCPYYAQDMVPSELVVQNYHRRRVRPARACVIDEAHNLVEPHEKVITIARLAEAASALRHSPASSHLVSAVEKLLRHVVSIAEGPVLTSLYFDEDCYNELRRIYAELLIEEPEKARALRPLVDLAQGTAYIEEEIHIFKEPQLPRYRPLVLVTATPPPVLPLEVEVELRIPQAVKPKAVLLSHVTTAFSQYSKRMATEYKKLILDWAKRYKRTLVVVPSERVARDLRAWATHYETAPPKDWEGVLMFRARSRLSEGLDLKAELVIVAGCPYLPPNVSEQLARYYRSKGLPDPAKLAIDAPMLVATVQGVGRAWRDPSAQPPTVVLADWRFERYKEELKAYFDLEEH